MAMRPLEVKIDADVRGAKRGLETLSDSLEDVIDTLDDLADQGDDTARELAGDFRKIERDADDAGDKVKKHLGDGFDEAKGEAFSSGREAAASFSGGFDDLGDLLQEVAANAFAGFGPAGAAGGLLAAAGLGIAKALFDQAEERRKALEEKASDLANAYIEAGTTVLNELDLASRVGDVATSTDPTEKQNLKDLTDALGDRALALRVLAGDTGALSTAEGILASKRKALDDANYITGSGKRKSALSEEAEKVEDLVRLLGEQGDVQKSAAQQAKDYSDALKQMADDAGAATVQVDEFGNQLITLPSGVQIVVDAKTGQASDNIDNFKGDVESIPKKHVTNVEAYLKVNDRALRTYKPPILYIEGRIVPKGYRQAV